MIIILSLLSICGATITIYSLSPYFSSLGLVLLSFSVCCFLSYFGYSFLGLILLLTYLGGMVVVFIYSSALTLDRYPLVGGWSGFVVVVFFFLGILSYLSGGCTIGTGGFFSSVSSSFNESLDWSGSGLLYYSYWGLLFLVGLCLLVVLVFVLLVTFGCYKGSLRSL
uniref:NADH-ubiquinone oxidoreductase chain 6 n=1 Tax=Protankyra bidentata TaxID=2904677 RepID=A0AAU7E399_9ECHN